MEPHFELPVSRDLKYRDGVRFGSTKREKFGGRGKSARPKVQLMTGRIAFFVPQVELNVKQKRLAGDSSGATGSQDGPGKGNTA